MIDARLLKHVGVLHLLRGVSSFVIMISGEKCHEQFLAMGSMVA